MNLLRAGEIVAEERVAERLHARGHQVGNNADDAGTSAARKRERERIVAGKNSDGAALADLAGGVHRASGFLDRNDVWMTREPRDRFRIDRNAATTGDVVEHHRQRATVGDGHEMAIKAFLGRLVVVRRDLKARVGTEVEGQPLQVDRVAGAVGSCAGKHLHAA